MCSVGMSPKGILKNAKEYQAETEVCTEHKAINCICVCVILVIAYCCAQEYLAMHLWA